MHNMKIESPITQDSTPIVFSAEMMTEINAVIAMFPEGKSKSALIRILHIVQTHYGWTSVPAMNTVAEILNIQPIGHKVGRLLLRRALRFATWTTANGGRS